MNPFTELGQEVKKAGKRAKDLQREVLRDFKHDGSILTEADLEINRTLSETIRRLFPDANIIAEEQETPFVSEQRWTFTIDPIDGTDAYSQGMPGWCVAVGIHNSELDPIGGFISAPSWGTDPELGLFVSRFPAASSPGSSSSGFSSSGSSSSASNTTDAVPRGSEVSDPKEEGELIGACTHDTAEEDHEHSGGQVASGPEKRPSSLMIGSKVHKRYDYSSYPGKIRSIGSSILHALSPYIYSDVAAAVLTPVYIWDISAAHGIVRSRGVETLYPDGSELLYETMVHRQRSAHSLFVVRSGMEAQVFRHFVPRQ